MTILLYFFIGFAALLGVYFFYIIVSSVYLIINLSKDERELIRVKAAIKKEAEE